MFKIKYKSVALIALLAVSSLPIVSAVNAQETQAPLGASVKVAQDDPYKMVEQVASKTFARIKLEQENIKKDPEIFRTIMEEELMPYIDYRFSAYKVLGKYTRQIKQKELLEFVTVFREYYL